MPRYTAVTPLEPETAPIFSGHPPSPNGLLPCRKPGSGHLEDLTPNGGCLKGDHNANMVEILWVVLENQQRVPRPAKIVSLLRPPAFQTIAMDSFLWLLERVSRSTGMDMRRPVRKQMTEPRMIRQDIQLLSNRRICADRQQVC